MHFSDLGKLGTSALHFTNVGSFKGNTAEIRERRGSRVTQMERHYFILKGELQKERKHQDKGDYISGARQCGNNHRFRVDGWKRLTASSLIINCLKKATTGPQLDIS